MPSCRPADLPTDLPTCRPADVPTWRPTDLPTCQPADLPTCRPADVPTCHLKARPGSGQNVTRIKIAIGFSNHRGRRREGVPRMPSRRFLDASDALWWRWCRDAPVATRAQARNSCQSRVVQEAATSNTRERRLYVTLQWSPHYPEQTSNAVRTARGNFPEKLGTGNGGAPNFRVPTSLKHSAPPAPLETFAQTGIPRAGRNSLRDNWPAKFGAIRIPVPRFSEIEAPTVAPSAQSRGSRNARRRPRRRRPHHPPWTRPRTRRHGLRF